MLLVVTTIIYQLTSKYQPPVLNNQMQLVISFNPYQNPARLLCYYFFIGVGTETQEIKPLAKDT